MPSSPAMGQVDCNGVGFSSNAELVDGGMVQSRRASAMGKFGAPAFNSDRSSFRVADVRPR